MHELSRFFGNFEICILCFFDWRFICDSMIIIFVLNINNYAFVLKVNIYLKLSVNNFGVDSVLDRSV